MLPLIAGNWKMHGDMSWVNKPAEFDRLYALTKRAHIEVLLCPPLPFLAPMVRPCQRAGILLGAQNCYNERSGAHTGEVSADMLKSVGANYVILGHSERRAEGETNEDVRKKAIAASEAQITPIICVGESLAQRDKGQAIDIVSEQIAKSVPDIKDYVIAYEPIWAIGTGKTATLDDISEMHGAIRALIGAKTRILYGGSVKPANAKGILATPNVNGALIGGASLDMKSFSEVAQLA